MATQDNLGKDHLNKYGNVKEPFVFKAAEDLVRQKHSAATDNNKTSPLESAKGFSPFGFILPLLVLGAVLFGGWMLIDSSVEGSPTFPSADIAELSNTIQTGDIDPETPNNSTLAAVSEASDEKTEESVDGEVVNETAEPVLDVTEADSEQPLQVDVKDEAKAEDLVEEDVEEKEAKEEEAKEEEVKEGEVNDAPANPITAEEQTTAKPEQEKVSDSTTKAIPPAIAQESKVEAHYYWVVYSAESALDADRKIEELANEGADVIPLSAKVIEGERIRLVWNRKFDSFKNALAEKENLPKVFGDDAWILKII